MQLTIKDRIVLPGLMPQRAKFEDLVCSEEIRAKVKFTAEQLTECGIKTLESGTGYTWEDDKKTFDFEFTELESALIKRLLEELSGKNELSADFIGLYRLFVTAPKETPKA